MWVEIFGLSLVMVQVKTFAEVLQKESKVNAGPYAPAR